MLNHGMQDGETEPPPGLPKRATDEDKEKLTTIPKEMGYDKRQDNRYPDCGREWVVTCEDPSQQFAGPGDSGASIWAGRSPVGMLWGGSEMEGICNGSIGFVSSLTEVFEDVKSQIITVDNIVGVELKPMLEPETG
ncbi:hypothetical protein MKZ38_008370 [Zalerion maritima]|uniref:Uncharacterized protein n=1 Tax=Zalerion maritima TaxID=339359 RepID=A0AAD5RV21_9PEZI|nr:hypothetical protein MKZ38_008370 [Zalerion maritima]